jgi:hypothetical protein
VRSAGVTCLLGLWLGIASPSTAATISLEGQLPGENAVLEFLLSVSDPAGATIEVRSFGYGGGLNGALQAIASGGFAPSLSLYTTDSAAFPQLVAQDAFGGSVIPGPPDSCSNGTNIDSSTGFCLDTVLSYTTGGPGTYVLKLSQQGNDGPSFLSDPYPESLPAGFLDPFGNPRSDAYALDISGAALDTAAVPEPAQSLLILAGLATLAAAKVRAHKRASVGPTARIPNS